MTWVVMRTDTFLESLKTVKKNNDVLAELDKKLIRLSENPLHVGGWLSGELHGKKSRTKSSLWSDFLEYIIL
ncbi:hypothetical protein C5S42_02140 [Candidatus Methanomarinus sp.]|nr:hypothetical protein C5S42_02140 [ANME-2 cluster archaeon]